MRIKEQNFQSSIKRALGNKTDLSAESKAALFAQAEILLAKRREHLSARELGARKVLQRGERLHFSLQKSFSCLIEILAIQPDVPAAGAAFLALILAFLAFHGSHPRFNPAYSDVPEFSKNNDFQARYDAERLAEQQAYEREVEDAHKNTSGGL
jgi:hypothetical protein